MRIRILQKPISARIDGIQLEHFYPGFLYDVGNVTGALLLAEGWAEPVADDQPALLIPFNDNDQQTRSITHHQPSQAQEPRTPDFEHRTRRR